MSSRQRLTYLGIAAVIAVVAVVVIVATGGSGGDSGLTTGTTRIVVKNGKVVGGVAKIHVKKGDEIRFTVTADVADEIHVHAFDLHKEIKSPGGSVSFAFPASITGITEAELENHKLQVAEIRVDP